MTRWLPRRNDVVGHKGMNENDNSHNRNEWKAKNTWVFNIPYRPVLRKTVLFWSKYKMFPENRENVTTVAVQSFVHGNNRSKLETRNTEWTMAILLYMSRMFSLWDTFSDAGHSTLKL